MIKRSSVMRKGCSDLLAESAWCTSGTIWPTMYLANSSFGFKYSSYIRVKYIKTYLYLESSWVEVAVVNESTESIFLVLFLMLFQTSLFNHFDICLWYFHLPLEGLVKVGKVKLIPIIFIGIKSWLHQRSAPVVIIVVHVFTDIKRVAHISVELDVIRIGFGQGVLRGSCFEMMKENDFSIALWYSPKNFDNGVSDIAEANCLENAIFVFYLAEVNSKGYLTNWCLDSINEFVTEHLSGLEISNYFILLKFENILYYHYH